MPIYTWACDGCGRKTDVLRRMSEIDIGPDSDEIECGHSGAFHRILSVFNFKKSTDGNYPLRVKLPEGTQIFTSEKQQRQWADQHGYVLSVDYTDDATFEGSQRSVFDKPYVDTPPPGVSASASASSLVTDDLSELPDSDISDIDFGDPPALSPEVGLHAS